MPAYQTIDQMQQNRPYETWTGNDVGGLGLDLSKLQTASNLYGQMLQPGTYYNVGSTKTPEVIRPTRPFRSFWQNQGSADDLGSIMTTLSAMGPVVAGLGGWGNILGITGGEAGVPAAAGAWAPSQTASFSTSMPFAPQIAEAQSLAGEGLTAAEMQELGVSGWASTLGSSGLPNVTKDWTDLYSDFSNASKLSDIISSLKEPVLKGGQQGQQQTTSAGSSSGTGGTQGFSFLPQAGQTTALPGTSDVAGTKGPGQAVYTGPGAPPVSNTGDTRNALGLLGVDTY